MTTLPAEATSALHEGRQAYVAVDASSGPHVTPELYACSGGRIWFASATTTVKAKALDRTHVGAVCVGVPGRAVLASGPVESFDLRRPLSLLTRVHVAPAALRALGVYGLRNASDLAAFGGDLVRGRLGHRPPPLRTLFALDPRDGAVLEHDRVTRRWGAWAGDLDPAAAPQPVRPGGIPVVAAVPGPIALPARWFPDDRQLHLDEGLVGRLPVTAPFPIAFAGDEYSAPGPDAKLGLLLRGTAQASCEPNELLVEVDRVVEWDGVRSSTTQV